MIASSVADLPESELVRLIYGERTVFGWLALPPGVSPTGYRLGVVPRDLGLPDRSFGDIDALIVGDSPTDATAIEFKRVKVTARTFSTGLPNKLRELAKACDQAAALARVGFGRVWIQVLIVIDAREVTGGRFNATPGIFELHDQVRAALPLAKLHQSVGVNVMHFVQPVDRSVTLSGEIGGGPIREPKSQEQPLALSATIRELFTAPAPAI